MATKNFYHGKLADIVVGSANFAAQIAADFAALGLTSAQSTAFGALNTTLQSCWALSSVPETRTSVTIEATRDAVDAMREAAIPLAKQLVGNPAVSDSQLVALGLLPRTTPTQSQLITVMPALTVEEVQGRNVRIRVRDASGATRGKLPGAIGAMVFSYVGATPPSGAEGWTNEGPITKDSAIIAFDESVAVGAKVWFAAQWFNSKGTGPGCTPVGAMINDEGSLVA